MNKFKELVMTDNKYFTKFDNPVYKEKILAKIMDLNYKILFITRMYDDKSKELEKVLKARRYVTLKAYLDSERYMDYCKAKIQSLLINNENLRKIKPKDYEVKIKKNGSLINKYLQRYKYYDFDFKLLLKASEDCVTEKGEIISFKELDSEIQQNLTYENANDIYINLMFLHNVGWNLADLYYRSIIMKHNMPCFITKSDMEKFEKKVKTRFRQIGRFPEDTDCPIMTDKYNKSFEIEKELYESVFPEFGFKYEDSIGEKSYSIEFQNVHDDDYEL